MKIMISKPPKGMKDFLPREQIVMEELFSVLRNTFKKYGFSPLETPVMENLDVLIKKGTGGSEVGKEIFTLKDRGGRKFGLKFDLTVPLARVLASNPTIPMPFKRYQIERVWRQEFGTRTREFWQCDVDIVGSPSPLADAEMLAIAEDVFEQLNIKVTIKYNSRKLLNNILIKAGVPGSKQTSLITEIDKLEKGTGKVPLKILKLIESAKVSDEPELLELSKSLKKMGVKAQFDSTLARGLDYYTGLVFEVVSKDYRYSLAGGGRFDKLLKNLGGRDLPATGISFGLSRIYEVLTKNRKVEPKETVTQLYVIPIGTVQESIKITKQLRSAGINTDLDLLGRSPSKNLTYSDKLGIPYVLLVGKKELTSNKFVLKNMKTGKEQELNIQKVIRLIKEDR